MTSDKNVQQLKLKMQDAENYLGIGLPQIPHFWGYLFHQSPKKIYKIQI